MSYGFVAHLNHFHRSRQDLHEPLLVRIVSSTGHGFASEHYIPSSVWWPIEGCQSILGNLFALFCLCQNQTMGPLVAMGRILVQQLFSYGHEKNSVFHSLWKVPPPILRFEPNSTTTSTVKEQLVERDLALDELKTISPERCPIWSEDLVLLKICPYQHKTHNLS